MSCAAPTYAANRQWSETQVPGLLRGSSSTWRSGAAMAAEAGGRLKAGHGYSAGARFSTAPVAAAAAGCVDLLTRSTWRWLPVTMTTTPALNTRIICRAICRSMCRTLQLSLCSISLEQFHRRLPIQPVDCWFMRSIHACNSRRKKTKSLFGLKVPCHSLIALFLHVLFIYFLISSAVYIVAFTENVCGTECLFMCWFAAQKLFIIHHSSLLHL